MEYLQSGTLPAWDLWLTPVVDLLQLSSATGSQTMCHQFGILQFDQRLLNLLVGSPSLCLCSSSHSGMSHPEGQGRAGLDDPDNPQVALSAVVHRPLSAVF